MAGIRLKLNKGVLEVISIDTNHNHAVNEALYNFYPGKSSIEKYFQHLIINTLFRHKEILGPWKRSSGRNVEIKAFS